MRYVHINLVAYSDTFLDTQLFRIGLVFTICIYCAFREQYPQLNITSNLLPARHPIAMAYYNCIQF